MRLQTEGDDERVWEGPEHTCRFMWEQLRDRTELGQWESSQGRPRPAEPAGSGPIPTATA